jgi:chromosomal replication initiator protein
LELPAQLDELTPAWRRFRAELKRAVGETTWEIWLSRLELTGREGPDLLLQAPPTTQAWIAKRFGRVLDTCARSAMGEDIRVRFTSAQHGKTSTVSARADAPQPDRGSTLNPRYSFDQFVIGEGNRLAHGAALAVAELPGQAYNPLFLHAPQGLGKTHLLHAIGNYMLSFGGGATVRYTTVEAFTNHFITSLNSRSLERFKGAYRDADVLLIDDVQFLASKAKTGEEFFHTFNALHETGRQLVLTCDRLPQQLRDVEERLRERFESGLVADIRPPDFATRVTILRKRAALDQIALTNTDVLELIAERITDNVRALEGALIRIVAHHSLTGRAIDTELATQILDGLYPHRPSPLKSTTREQVKQTVASYFEISPDEIVSSSRAARVAWPRQVAIYLTRELTDSSLQEVGATFGGRNHATVVHACKRVSERLQHDPEAAGDVDNLLAKLDRP